MDPQKKFRFFSLEKSDSDFLLPGMLIVCMALSEILLQLFCIKMAQEDWSNVEILNLVLTTIGPSARHTIASCARILIVNPDGISDPRISVKLRL